MQRLTLAGLGHRQFWKPIGRGKDATARLARRMNSLSVPPPDQRPSTVTCAGTTTDRNGKGHGTNTDVGLSLCESHSKKRIRHGTGGIVAAIANFVEWICGTEIF
jgi:hypothetical protein